jgi:hypothetical protein
MEPIVIDPRLYAPEVRGVSYDSEGNQFLSETETIEDIGEALLSPVIEEETPLESDILQPPESVTLVQEIIRISPDGKVVVDAVLEIGDVVGAVEYESREAVA